MKKKSMVNTTLFILFLIFILLSWYFGYSEGKKAAASFTEVLGSMIKLLPCAFILVGLFETWVKRETVIRHLGEGCGPIGYLWVLVLAGFTVGGLYTAFPIAQSLRKKGASAQIIFTYLGFTGIIRIPMTVFEITFLGPLFTAVRLASALPLFLVTGIILGRYFSKTDTLPEDLL
ncbi:MAG: permease [Fibrobacterota bacterium]